MKLNNAVYADGKKAVLYLRVSTEEQVDNFSLGTQEEICRKEAEKRGYQVIEMFREEGRSAKSITGRPVLIQLLEYCRRHKQVTPKKECLNLFITFLYRTYHQRLSRLQKIKSEADQEIETLKALRKTLVEKNLDGVYSDEVYKEQNAVIEDRMTKAQIVKDDATIDKYNIEGVTTFIRTLLADLGETYKRSSLSQIKVLLGSIFPSGLAWNQNGTLNHQISPLYQSICTFDTGAIFPCAGDRS